VEVCAVSEQIKATFEIASWDENPFDEHTELAKLTEALVGKNYAGDIEGTSTTRWLLAYELDESATFVGIERVLGTVGGKRGSLVLRHVGQFVNGAATATLTVVSGTDELANATGTGNFVADPAGSVTLDLTL
jgi:hypothetical protein